MFTKKHVGLRTKVLLAVAVAMMALAAGSCGTIFTPTRPIGVSETLPPQLQTAQATINETNILLTATANVVAQNLKDGVYTKAEAQSYLDKVKSLASQVDTAQALIRVGDMTAMDKTKLIQQAVVVLHREVAARARKGG